MPEYILFMHDDLAVEESAADWGPYLDRLKNCGAFRGGIAIGAGSCVRHDAAAGPLSIHLTGFIRVEAQGIDDVRRLLVGNPVFDAGGTIEIRELPKAD